MENIKIYTRGILEKTGYRAHPYREKKEFSIFYDDVEINNHYGSISNPRLKVKYERVLDTNNLNKIEEYMSGLSTRSTIDKEIRLILTILLKNPEVLRKESIDGVLSNVNNASIILYYQRLLDKINKEDSKNE